MTKVNIISGFLGAGKTTLIKKLLNGAFEGEKVVLLENEYGEVGIDGGFMKDSGIQVTEINSGCICCTLVGDFSDALVKMIDTYHPDRILIEPSGVGKLSDIRKVVSDVAEAHHELVLAGCATVADVNKCRMYAKNFGEFFLDQIQSAETIILSRTQFASQERIDKTVELLREHNARARIVTTPWDDLDAKKILETIEKPDFLLTIDDLFTDDDDGDHDHEHHHDHDHEEHEHHHEHDENCTCGCHDHDHEHHHHHHADDVFTSWGEETPNKYDKEALDAILKKLANTNEYGSILRAKGMLPANDGTWMYFDLVPEEYEIREGNPDYTGRICVIGAELKEDALKELFNL